MSTASVSSSFCDGLEKVPGPPRQLVTAERRQGVVGGRGASTVALAAVSAASGRTTFASVVAPSAATPGLRLASDSRRRKPPAGAVTDESARALRPSSAREPCRRAGPPRTHGSRRRTPRSGRETTRSLAHEAPPPSKIVFVTSSTLIPWRLMTLSTLANVPTLSTIRMTTWNRAMLDDVDVDDVGDVRLEEKRADDAHRLGRDGELGLIGRGRDVRRAVDEAIPRLGGTANMSAGYSRAPRGSSG